MGASSPREAVLTAYARSLIQFKANQLCQKPGFSPTDREDLEQEFTLYLLSKAHLYDPNRGAKIDTFADRVVTSAVRILLRDRRRLKRAPGFHTRSIHTMFGGSDGGGSLADQLEAKHQIRVNASATSGDAPNTPLGKASGLSNLEHEDFHRIFKTLPPEDQDLLLRLLTRAHSVVAKDLGISRRQLDNRLAAVGKRFEDAGFGSS